MRQQGINMSEKQGLGIIKKGVTQFLNFLMIYLQTKLIKTKLPLSNYIEKQSCSSNLQEAAHGVWNQRGKQLILFNLTKFIDVLVPAAFFQFAFLFKYITLLLFLGLTSSFYHLFYIYAPFFILFASLYMLFFSLPLQFFNIYYMINILTIFLFICAVYSRNLQITLLENSSSQVILDNNQNSGNKLGITLPQNQSKQQIIASNNEISQKQNIIIKNQSNIVPLVTQNSITPQNDNKPLEVVNKTDETLEKLKQSLQKQKDVKAADVLSSADTNSLIIKQLKQLKQQTKNQTVIGILGTENNSSNQKLTIQPQKGINSLQNEDKSLTPSGQKNISPLQSNISENFSKNVNKIQPVPIPILADAATSAPDIIVVVPPNTAQNENKTVQNKIDEKQISKPTPTPESIKDSVDKSISIGNAVLAPTADINTTKQKASNIDSDNVIKNITTSTPAVSVNINSSEIKNFDNQTEKKKQNLATIGSQSVKNNSTQTNFTAVPLSNSSNNQPIKTTMLISNDSTQIAGGLQFPIFTTTFFSNLSTSKNSSVPAVQEKPTNTGLPVPNSTPSVIPNPIVSNPVPTIISSPIPPPIINPVINNPIITSPINITVQSNPIVQNSTPTPVIPTSIITNPTPVISNPVIPPPITTIPIITTPVIPVPVIPTVIPTPIITTPPSAQASPPPTPPPTFVLPTIPKAAEISKTILADDDSDIGPAPKTSNFGDRGVFLNTRNEQLRNSPRFRVSSNLIFSNAIKPEMFALKDIKRSIDGSGNNELNRKFGAVNSSLVRKCKANYIDGRSIPVNNLPSPRLISNTVGAARIPFNKNKNNVTLAFTLWGQFIDHDIEHSLTTENQVFHIPIPRCDKQLDFDCNGSRVIPFTRTLPTPGASVRIPMNDVSSWLDASMIYGSTQKQASKLRTFRGGQLKSDVFRLLPSGQRVKPLFNDLLRGGADKNIPNQTMDAGDTRSNENLVLLGFHTIFLREHNRICDIINRRLLGLRDEQIYTIAKNYVTALIQKITFDQYLPILLGAKGFNDFIGSYKGYDNKIDPSLDVQFTTAGYRFGHSLVVNQLPLYNMFGDKVQTIRMDATLFRPDLMTTFNLERIMRGATRTITKDRDGQFVDQIRNLLVIAPELRSVRMDLLSINIERGRDHGLPDFNSLRECYGLKRLFDFSEISAESSKNQQIRSAYGNINNVDSYVGIQAQKSVQGSILGETGIAIIGANFKRLRDGDRFWYERIFPQQLINEIKSTMLSQVILRNTSIMELQWDVFHYNFGNAD